MAVEFKVGDIIEGTVIELRKFGALMIFEHDINGLLHISEISDRFVFDISRYIQVGRNYNVKILEIDSNNHFMKVSLRKVTIEDRLDHKAQARKRSLIDKEDIDFEPLKEQLDTWTKEQVEQTPEDDEDAKG